MSRPPSPHLAIAKQLAARPDGVANGEFAREAQISASLAGALLASFVSSGHIHKGAPPSGHARFFDTAERAEAFRWNKQAKPLAADRHPIAIARQAVAFLRGQTLSSSALGKLCDVSADKVDAALAPLADAKRLVRVVVQRLGVNEFDYRWAATWWPQDADFLLCRDAKESPVAAISPIASPAPSPVSTPAPAPTPSLTSRPPAPTAEDRRESGRSGGHSKSAQASLDRALTARPESLGWGVPRAEAPAEPLAIADQAAVHIAVEDLVCALNSRGELALDIGDKRVITFEPARALELTRFLSSSTFLEGMAARGEL